MSAELDWFYATTSGACYGIGGQPGSGVWRRTPGTNGTIVTAPAVKEGIRKVWAGTTDGYVITFDAADLSIVRTVSFGNPIARTVCHGPNLIVTTEDGHLFAIDPQTEQIRWSQQTGVAVAPFVETTDVLLTNTTGGMTAFDAYSGALLWQFIRFAGYPTGFASAANGVFYVISWDAYELRALRASDGSEIWSLGPPAYPGFSGVVAVGDAVYAVQTGKVYSLDAATGAENWSAATPPGTGFTLSPWYAKRWNAEDVIIVPFYEPPGLAAYAVTTGLREWLTTPLPGSQLGDTPIGPEMRYFTGLIALPGSNNVYYCLGDTGQIEAQFALAATILGVAYLQGEISGWPKP
jgi:hypothetical protein